MLADSTSSSPAPATPARRSASSYSCIRIGPSRSGRRCWRRQAVRASSRPGWPARSTRTEAGLPLYGHELAGHFDVSPNGRTLRRLRRAAQALLHRPVGLHGAEAIRTMEVARFRMNDRGVRMPKTGDPVVNKKGQAIG